MPRHMPHHQPGNAPLSHITPPLHRLTIDFLPGVPASPVCNLRPVQLTNLLRTLVSFIKYLISDVQASFSLRNPPRFRWHDGLIQSFINENCLKED